ncbi:MAG: hypothetical protein K2Y28_02230 [Burkholderiaceae bacterium]|nr:hypothetical protein [Burkholderiaceae bacterium]
MKRIYTLFSVIFILFGAAGNALAESSKAAGGFLGFGKRQGETHRNNSPENVASRKEFQKQRQGERAFDHRAEKPALDKQNGENPKPNAPSGDGAGNAKTGRLTLEERRALRRQIREAGNDIYTKPK